MGEVEEGVEEECTGSLLVEVVVVVIGDNLRPSNLLFSTLTSVLHKEYKRLDVMCRVGGLQEEGGVKDHSRRRRQEEGEEEEVDGGEVAVEAAIRDNTKRLTVRR